ncbi:hypothetical protein [Desulfocurvibacter africanus]|uniref:PEP-CTERM sorting domain-containing protein n=1 Tax=Desulfocurvibacter africanus subsp. africanus str. Walvis Bay TaxID=690850 RepID=F3YV06_DESAF|nr:hypothetical protein [Desulfocurvibacter africanus]EGJ49256.1 hypothetical protein Desaf_0908 [Desulfocurvibacter africanus subsp. africanus str. Walvis Bay]
MARFILALIMGAFLAAPAYAAESTFGDGTIYWPGSPEAEDAYPEPTDHNTQDHYGTPDITGGVASATDGLDSVQFNIVITREADWTEELWRNVWFVLYPGDLFLDTNSDGVWEYVVVMNPDKTDWTPIDTYVSNTQFGLNRDAGLYPLHRFTAPLQAPFTGAYPYHETIKPANFRPRYDHPIWADMGSGYMGAQVGSVQFSGWPTFPEGYNMEPLPVTFDFNTTSLQGLNIPTNNLTIGFTISTASDVILQQVSVASGEHRPCPISVPNMLLLQ